MLWIIYLTIFFVLQLKTSGARMDCSKNQYEKCIKMADPLVKEAHLVFPDNIDDIDQVCTTWNHFVDCLKVYTDGCFTAQQRKQFNRAVESPIESVHEMCTQPSYQKEYLLYAPCIKNTIIQNIHCGQQYNLLVDQVDQGDIISKSTLCCSHDRFKNCVQKETRRLCDRGVVEGPASGFAMQIIDKALSFLQDQCLNYIPNSGDCQIHPTDSLPFGDRSDPLAVATPSNRDTYPWSTVYSQKSPKELFPASRITPPTVSTPTSWSPSSSPSRQQQQQSSSSDQLFPTQMLGTRTRPASYGRSSSWGVGGEVDSNNVAGNTVQMYPDVPSSPSPRPSWTTVSSWNRARQSSTTSGFDLTSQNIFSPPSYNSPSTESSTMWYPAAGNQLDSEVDEPNQLGLQKPRNSANNNSLTTKIGMLTTICMIVTSIYI